MTKLGEKNVGDIVKMNDNAKAGSEYIIIHKGKPSPHYSSDCDGIWIMRKNAVKSQKFDDDQNDLYASDLQLFLSYFNAVSNTSALKPKVFSIPYYSGTGKSGTAMYGEGKGYACYCSTLSAVEVGFSASANSKIPNIGTQFGYFQNAASRKCVFDDGTAASWWLRIPVLGTVDQAFSINTDGSLQARAVTDIIGYRPVFLMNEMLNVDENNFLLPANLEPVITTELPSELGTLTEGFSCGFSVNDSDVNDELTVTLLIDDTAVNTFPGVRGQAENYTLGGTDWLKIPNGSHTFKIALNDGSITVTKSAGFERNCTSMEFFLSQPQQTEKPMEFFSLRLLGNIPSDAEIKYEACNNAFDEQPAWEDITRSVRTGINYKFKNNICENDPAVNFRITAQRGSSNEGGFIEKIICEYE